MTQPLRAPPLSRRATLLVLASTPLLLSWPAQADDFPSSPIRLIVPFGAGSITDIIARKVGDKAGSILNQSFVVDNRPGAGGAIGAAIVAKAEPDGYTICMGTVASHAIAAALESLLYDLATDFKAVTLLVTSANLIAVNASVPAKTLPEYLDYARRKGVSLYVSGGVATTTQLLPELIKVWLNVPLQHVPAAKVGDSFNDLLAGRVDMMCYPAIGLQPYLNSGAVRPLAVASPTRIKALPDVPTVTEALGSKDYDLISWFGVFAPAKTPDAIVYTFARSLNGRSEHVRRAEKYRCRRTRLGFCSFRCILSRRNSTLGGGRTHNWRPRAALRQLRICERFGTSRSGTSTKK